MNASGKFTSLLDAPLEPAQANLARRAVLLPLAVAATLLVCWSSLAPISGAVIAAARIKVELERKTVQHREGGIVREIRVRNGQKVHAGDVLVVVDDVRSDAELSLLEDQLLAERVRHARVLAETTLAGDFDFDAQLSTEPRAREHLAREREQFSARRRTLDEQISALQTQVREAHAQAAALGSQIESIETAGRLSAEELKLNEKLVTQGFVPRARLLPLQRADADYRSQLGASRGELALSRQRAAELV